ncbi:Hypothetical protein FKW44_020136 [Caligus rogercresseyi]|uniref:Uncharacterized protein n=1 Tax=Caligus rogercresseyi TaxID=217165 RepID=A0A7T8GXJ7_CALRO|nr:Hypothetical protein FKW44_020136 [Caligus rogercresseyi]
MRLSAFLRLWPKNMPGGSIHKGKYRIHRHPKEGELSEMSRDMKRELNNIALTSQVGQQRKGDLRADQIWFGARKAKIEATVMGPAPLKNHYNQLYRRDSWDS